MGQQIAPSPIFIIELPCNKYVWPNFDGSGIGFFGFLLIIVAVRVDIKAVSFII
jgi:hypothetical protein